MQGFCGKIILDATAATTPSVPGVYIVQHLVRVFTIFNNSINSWRLPGWPLMRSYIRTRYNVYAKKRTARTAQLLLLYDQRPYHMILMACTRIIYEIQQGSYSYCCTAVYVTCSRCFYFWILLCNVVCCSLPHCADTAVDECSEKKWQIGWQGIGSTY